MSTPSPTNSSQGLSVRPGAGSNLPPPPARNRAFGSTLQLLALCPLLAVSDTVVKALGFSVLVLVIFPLATLLFSGVRRWLDDAIVLPASLLVTAGLVTAAELFMRAWFHDLGAWFGVFLPLLAVNIVVIDHIQTSDLDRRTALIRSVRIALGIALTLIALGLARELVGRGSLLSGAATLFGSWGERLEIKVFSVDMGFLLAMLPPGAFISLGLLIAARNWWRGRNQRVI
ncbi:electron transport complex subunit E [Steroidobacter agaridevorans]|uniref:Electron transport complex subunit E n=1 Tax=Steroidobacter agaridevorans TaxID=2695856 RepID=A0A829YNY2_9GAMM|nr:Rnf-Nqr domain containing protein [Steroidobacter agaridevorans]GFE84552.1 electron transport complex subunit E [Steroidobacter agaridevorans]GFE90951.1 electron transport complex subunit E [Steroidobacter agaridevorans]